MKSGIDDRVFDLACEIFGLLAAPTRLRIVCTLIEGEKNVSELLRVVAISQPNMSQHLGVLYRSGILTRRRSGSQVIYRVEHQQVRELCAAIKAPQPADSTPTAPDDRNRSQWHPTRATPLSPQEQP